MNKLFSRLLKISLITASLLFAYASSAEVSPLKTFTVKPDYRKCAAPMCGGWFITPVNQFSTQLENDDAAYQNSLLVPQSIYVASINLSNLNLTPTQKLVLEASMRSEQALLRGYTFTSLSKVTTLTATQAWTSPNKNKPVGPYLNVSSSGIVCITTPCPYYKADLINSTYSVNFDALAFDKAGLTSEQETQAWQAVAGGGLVMTGVSFISKGQTGNGVGIDATKVFFNFPPVK